jgi:hypothetical protein
MGNAWLKMVKWRGSLEVEGEKMGSRIFREPALAKIKKEQNKFLENRALEKMIGRTDSEKRGGH